MQDNVLLIGGYLLTLLTQATEHMDERMRIGRNTSQCILMSTCSPQIPCCVCLTVWLLGNESENSLHLPSSPSPFTTQLTPFFFLLFIFYPPEVSFLRCTTPLIWHHSLLLPVSLSVVVIEATISSMHAFSRASSSLSLRTRSGSLFAWWDQKTKEKQEERKKSHKSCYFKRSLVFFKRNEEDSLSVCKFFPSCEKKLP